MPGPGDTPAPRRRAAPRGRKRAVVVSAALHVVALAAVLTLRADPPREPEPPVFAALEPPPSPAAPPEPKRQAATPAPSTAPAAAGSPSPAPPSPAPPVRARVAVQRPAPTTLAVSGTAKPEAEGAGDGVSEGEVAGAARAGGGSGRGCDMVARLEAALRKDGRVQAAIASRGAAGRAVRVWNGDWTESPGQEGRGLAAVREALLWEVGFAPEACRREPMRGLVLLSLGEGPGAGRVVLGAADWRWSDMLTARGVGGR